MITVMRGTITKVGRRPSVEVPDLAVGYDFGPCETLAAEDFVRGDRVLVAAVGDTPEDVVILGRMTPEDEDEVGRSGWLFRRLDPRYAFKSHTHPQSDVVGLPTRLNGIEADIAALEVIGGGGTPGADGADGKSAYELAVDHGFVGSEAAWLASLEGSDGVNGTDGTDGADGADGVDGTDGRGITSVARTTGTGAPGSLDTYTITYSDATTSTFQVYNGANGTGSVVTVNGVAPVSGNVTLPASAVPFTPTGGLASTNVAAALAELDGASGVDTEVKLSSFAGATDDAKLTAAMTAVNALTLRGVVIVLDENRDYTFAVQQTAYNGFALRGAFRPQDQARASRPIGNRVLLRMTGGIKGWFKMPPGGSTFGISISNLSIDGDASSGLIEGNEADGGVLWTSVFRDISIQNAAFVFGTASNKLLVTACTIDGWWNINNVQDRAWHIGGSDFWFTPTTMLLDSPTTVMADGEYLAGMDFQQNSWWRNIYCTAEKHSGFTITGGTSSHSNWFQSSVVEGRNSGAPCYGALMRFNGGQWNVQDCRFAFAMSNPALSGHSDKGVLHFAGGTHVVESCTYERGATPEATPFIYVSGGKVRVRKIQKAGTWVGKPICYQTAPGLIDADDSVTVVTAQYAAVQTGAGNVTSASANTGTSITVAKPSAVADGDVLWAAVAGRNNTAPYTGVPAGWTEVPPTVDITGPGVIRLYYKAIPTAASEPSTYAWTGGASGRHSGVIFRMTGVDPAVLDVAGAVSTLINTPDRVIVPGVTTTQDGDVLLAIGYSSTTGGTVGTFTHASMAQVGVTSTNTGASESSLTVLAETVGATGATGSRSILGSAATYSTGSGYMVAVKSTATATVTDRTYDGGVNFLGVLKENGQRVYSPANPPPSVGGAFAGLSDVALAGLTNGQFLKWDSAASKWKNVAVTVADLPVAATGVSDATKLVRSDDERLLAPVKLLDVAAYDDLAAYAAGGVVFEPIAQKFYRCKAAAAAGAHGSTASKPLVVYRDHLPGGTATKVYNVPAATVKDGDLLLLLSAAAPGGAWVSTGATLAAATALTLYRRTADATDESAGFTVTGTTGALGRTELVALRGVTFVGATSQTQSTNQTMASLNGAGTPGVGDAEFWFAAAFGGATTVATITTDVVGGLWIVGDGRDTTPALINWLVQVDATATGYLGHSNRVFMSSLSTTDWDWLPVKLAYVNATTTLNPTYWEEIDTLSAMGLGGRLLANAAGVSTSVSNSVATLATTTFVAPLSGRVSILLQGRQGFRTNAANWFVRWVAASSTHTDGVGGVFWTSTNTTSGVPQDNAFVDVVADRLVPGETYTVTWTLVSSATADASTPQIKVVSR